MAYQRFLIHSRLGQHVVLTHGGGGVGMITTIAAPSIGKVHVSGRFVEDKVLLPPISVVERHDLHTNASPSVRLSL